MSALIDAYRDLAAAHELLKEAHRGVARAVRRAGRGSMADFHRQEAGKARRLAERYRAAANALEAAGASRPGAAPTVGDDARPSAFAPQRKGAPEAGYQGVAS